MRDDLIIPVSVLDSKRGSDTEILIILFEKCNLRCPFCHQDHDSKVGASRDEILSHAQLVKDRYSGSGRYMVNISGGELFSDDIPDEYFDWYFDLAKEIDDTVEDLELTFVTNFVFKKTERFQVFLDRLVAAGIEPHIATSWDPVGRFNKEDSLTFFENLIEFKSYIRVVGTVLTAQNIRAIMEKKPWIFKWIHRELPVYFDHYSPIQRNDPLIPTDEQLVDFWLFCLEHYPNVKPLANWVEGASITTCRKTTITTPTGEIVTCRALPKEDRNNNFLDGELERQGSEYSFLEQYKCFECEYYSRCGLRCFLAHEYSGNKSPVCQYKRLFAFIESKE